MVSPWDDNSVLSLGSFPSTSVLRKKKGDPEVYGTCTCKEGERHRSLFDFNIVRVFPHLSGKDRTPLTGVKVCWNAESIWEIKLPRALTGLNKRVAFQELPNVYTAQKVLFDGTYWFRRLIRDEKDPSKKGINGIAVLRLLAGKPGFAGKEHIGQLVKCKVSPSGVMKLRQILATVDGMLMQLAILFPGDREIQTWSFMDRVANCLISCLLPDYFREGQPRSGETAFERIKALRKSVKETGFNPIGSWDDVLVPQQLSFFRAVLDRLPKKQSPWRGYLTTGLSQTRASGVPPKSLHDKTMEKTMQIFKEPATMELYNSFGRFIRPALNEIHQEILFRNEGVERERLVFSKIASAAKISLSDSGEFFTKSEDGGKLEACRKILSRIDGVDEINLHSGEKTGRFLRKGVDSTGEVLFHWACSQFIDRKKVYETNAMSVRISLVAELGKYRTITVSHIAHAMLLHVLNHMLLEYLSLIPSSESGIKAANHAWTFFERLSHKNPSAGFIFSSAEKYVFSTDWSNATDWCDHYVAAALLNNVCDILGVPRWYRQTCSFALCAPRQVEFKDQESKTLECFLSTRGVLMGDPVTKPVLHLYHLVVRTAIKQMIREADARKTTP
jgi:hypothetical protein